MAPISTSDPQKRGTPPRRRPRNLGQLLGISDAEAEDYSLSGRVLIITKLKAARNREIERGQSGSWLYDVSRHLSLCAALRMEYEALADFLLEQKQAELGRQRGDSAARLAGAPAHL